MLKGKTIFKNVVLIGSTSDIGLAILEEIPYSDDAEILLVGRAVPEQENVENKQAKTSFYKCDLENSDDLQRLVSKLSELNDIDLAIVAAGYLPPENMELDPALVRKSMMVNSVGVVTVLSALANRMHIQNRGHILHISTVAVIRPRLRNFNYGASKSSADFFAMGLSSKYRTTGLKVSVLRPGYVHTKMTNNFSPAPFATNTKLVARNAIQGVIKDRIVIYAPGFLRIFFLFLKILPNFIFKVIDQKS